VGVERNWIHNPMNLRIFWYRSGICRREDLKEKFKREVLRIIWEIEGELFFVNCYNFY
jgi:hypothetical protein